jgi:hypothetical protein
VTVTITVTNSTGSVSPSSCTMGGQTYANDQNYTPPNCSNYTGSGGVR